MSDYHPYITFPALDRRWRRKDPVLMKLYEALGRAIDTCDVFIHFNGALIHPDFIDQFKGKLTVYHSADDPDASNVLSRPVANGYDVCAISNPACLEMYKKWGCRQVFFWPLGAFHYDEHAKDDEGISRDIPIVFVGSKLGVPSVRYVGRYLGLYKKKAFMTRMERVFPEMVAWGDGWQAGPNYAAVPNLYRRARLGLNVHNSLGPLNGRLYDLAAFGVCQICDNKRNLSLVFKEGEEIVGFESARECIEVMRHYVSRPDEARRIGEAGKSRFLRDYTMHAIWTRFFDAIERIHDRPA
jgi:spore maturation protein CgeB